MACTRASSIQVSAISSRVSALKGKGGTVTELFNRGGSFPAGYVWLAEPSTDVSYNAWCQRLSDGGQDDYHHQNYELPVLCVVR